MQEAFGQALAYTSTIEPPPPFLVVTDIGYCFDLYASFDGTRNYRKFPDALRSRINIESLEREPQHLETLRAIFSDPHSLDPSKRSVTVTRDIAGHIANVARSLDDAGHDRSRSRSSSCAVSSRCSSRTSDSWRTGFHGGAEGPLASRSGELPGRSRVVVEDDE